MIAALLVVPLVDGYLAMGAFAVLFQHLVAQRVADVAAGHQVASVDEACAFVAEAAPGRPAAAVNPGIRAFTLEVAFVAAAMTCEVFHSGHIYFRLSHFAALLQLRLKPTFIYPTYEQVLAPVVP
jgi:hypothetical protein